MALELASQPANTPAGQWNPSQPSSPDLPRLAGAPPFTGRLLNVCAVKGEAVAMLLNSEEVGRGWLVVVFQHTLKIGGFERETDEL